MRGLLITALVAQWSLWSLLAFADPSISPLAVRDLPVGALWISVAALHLLTAPTAWVVGMVTLSGQRGGRLVLLGVLGVPLGALTTLGVLLSDALVWRGDLGDWLFPAMLALVGPIALTVFLVRVHTSLRRPPGVPPAPGPRSPARKDPPDRA